MNPRDLCVFRLIALSHFVCLCPAISPELLSYHFEAYLLSALKVYGKNDENGVTLTICIEDHQFQPKNFWFVLDLS